MKLVHITTVPMSLVFLRGQTGYMKRRGIEIHAISSPGPDLAAFAKAEDVAVTAVPMPRRITPLRDIVSVVRMWRVLRRVRPTIVHAHTPKGGLLGMIAATLARSPVRIYHVRGLPMLGATGLKRRVLYWTEWVACRLAHRVLCVSRSVREVLAAEGICDAARIRVLLAGSGNGVDAQHRFNRERLLPEREGVRDRLGIPSGARVIGFVGRIVRDKGIIELAAAWTGIREKNRDAHLLLVGPEEPQDPIPAATMAALRADDRVHLAGMDWDTGPLYAAMDVVALPTYREGFPNVPLEAAAMGLPVVATCVPGCVDAIVDQHTGTLVPARDAASLEAALLHYLENADERERHGRNARERVLRDYQPEAIWETLYEQYCQLAHGRASGAGSLSRIEEVA